MKTKLKQLGQGMTEYIIIVALIAIAGIAVYSLFGDVVRGQVGGMAAELGGQSGDESSGAATEAATNAASAGTEQKRLNSYGNE